MNEIVSLLANGAKEIRAYSNPKFISSASIREWVDRLAKDMTQASLIKDKAELELAILTLSRRLVDSGPMENDFCPSFDKALDAMQRSRKRDGS